MNPPSEPSNGEPEQLWIEEYLDGRISPADFEALQDRLAESPSFRATFRRYAALDSHLWERSSSEDDEAAMFAWESATPSPPLVAIARPRFVLRTAVPLAAAALAAFALGGALMGVLAPSGPAGSILPEASASGFAAIERLSDPVWPDDSGPRFEGDLVAGELFRLASGTAEIRFFSGASMIVEGPAEIALRSAWEAECRSGAVRMLVPPAARGFRLHGPDTEIVDLGTEFGLDVRDGTARVEVFDGEIALRHRGGPERLVEGGSAWELPASRTETPVDPEANRFPDPIALETGSSAQRATDFHRWTSYRDRLAADDRILAYYTFEEKAGLVPDLANRTGPLAGEHDGAIILAQQVDGRWPGLKPAMEFRRPGSRVRVRIDGEFHAFTFACWVRIDSLDRRYNALFLGDGYETGEPHWQIRDDGKMMLSVMVDDTRPSPYQPDDAGFHRVYFSPPMWDLSMSGRWLHLASVFDPENRRVSHYVDGVRIHRQEITDEYFIDHLRIGNAEIGNWGQPFREEPTFAIRNLNGRMGEIALFDAALADAEITELYEQSRAGKCANGR